MCINEIGLRVRNMKTTLIDNIIRNLYGHLISTKFFHFASEQHNLMSSKKYEERGYGFDLDLLITILH